MLGFLICRSFSIPRSAKQGLFHSREFNLFCLWRIICKQYTACNIFLTINGGCKQLICYSKKNYIIWNMFNPFDSTRRRLACLLFQNLFRKSSFFWKRILIAYHMIFFYSIDKQYSNMLSSSHNYLIETYSVATVGGIDFEPFVPRTGIPQGSALGPLLFINDTQNFFFKCPVNILIGGINLFWYSPIFLTRFLTIQDTSLRCL